MSKGAVGIISAYFLITFNVARVFMEVVAVKLLVDKSKIKTHIKEELPRKVGHMLVCFITYPMIYFSFKGTIHTIIFPALALLFVLIARPFGLLNLFKREETDDNLDSVIYLITGSLINFTIAYFNPAYLIPSALGVMSLGLGDPMACFVGKSVGKHKIYKRKTLEGTIGFIIGATIAMYIFSGLTLWKLLIVAICSAIVELYSDKYDNALIQIVCALVAFLII